LSLPDTPARRFRRLRASVYLILNGKSEAKFTIFAGLARAARAAISGG
jgi:hypothetical protein